MNIAEQITENQEWLMGRHSRTVGQVLDVIEASLPEGTQCEKAKSYNNWQDTGNPRIIVFIV